MDTVRFVEQCLNQVYERMVKSLGGLGPGQVLWRPAPHANCIAEVLWHTVRSEDKTVRAGVELKPELWDEQRWYERFGYPQDFARHDDYEILKEPDLPPPRLEDMLAYIEAVHRDTLKTLDALSPDDLDTVPDPEHNRQTIGATLRHLITHNNNHHGQMDYLRGLQETGWDLPPGTGIEQR